MNLPFKMRQETSLEKWRVDTWATKEPETIVWIQSFNPQDAFIDVGANIGIYSLYTASLFPRMSIFAIEPSLYNFEVLEYNNRINNFNIQCLNFGISDHFGSSKFLDANHIPGASGGQLNTEKGYDVILTMLEIIMLAQRKDKHFNIKIDVDSQELGVINGIRSAWHKVKSAMVEVNNDKEEICKIFADNGFTTKNKFNIMSPHSRERRKREGIIAENIIFTR